MSELKLCPFCGGKAKLSWTLLIMGERRYFIRCVQCELEMALSDTKTEAIKAWNRRANE